jgi:chromosome condensin MukBEF ATPase and DNA-binding subunit MukB|tara:strand:+ start:425 stop:661 length:237 start_codon:yes stop_codon:yes gene_type:complete
MVENVVSLTDLIETRLRKQQEIEYYQETLEKLQIRIGELGQEVNITTIIIDMIENERVLTIDEKRGKILLLDSKKEIK